jgi:hypothetical protein
LQYRNSHNSTLYLIIAKISYKLDLLLFYHAKHFREVLGVPLRFGVTFPT